MNRNRLLWLVFIGVGMFSNVVSSSNVWAGAPKTAQIVFVAYGRDGNQADIYVMDINSGRQRNLTKDAIADEVHPAWSPDGRKIAFVSYGDGVDSAIYIMDADGGGIVRLTTYPAEYPVWSPDGRQLAFHSNKNPEGVPNSDLEIYVIDADGENERQLTQNRTGDKYPDWFDPMVPHAVSSIGQRAALRGWLKQLNRRE